MNGNAGVLTHMAPKSALASLLPSYIKEVYKYSGGISKSAGYDYISNLRSKYFLYLVLFCKDSSREMGKASYAELSNPKVTSVY